MILKAIKENQIKMMIINNIIIKIILTHRMRQNKNTNNNINTREETDIAMDLVIGQILKHKEIITTVIKNNRNLLVNNEDRIILYLQIVAIQDRWL